MLDQLVPANIFAFLLVFARVGAVIMVLPGFGESFVLARFRLMLALAISLVLTPILAPSLPGLPPSPLTLTIILVTEIGIGFFIGISARILISALQIAGVVAAYQSSLANAFVFDPASAQQGALPGAFLTTTALLLIFVTDLHHVMLTGIASSYDVFAAGAVPVIGDLADTISRLVAKSFVLAMQIAAPFVAMGLLFSLGVGLLNRLLPQVQVFFIAMPMQVMLGIGVLALTLSAAMLWFLDAFAAGLRAIYGAG